MATIRPFSGLSTALGSGASFARAKCVTSRSNGNSFAESVNARRSPQEIGLAHLLNQITNRGSETWPSRTTARFAGPIARKRPPMPADHCVRLQDAQPMPPARSETGQPNPPQPVRLSKVETTWRALLKDGDLMAESNDLSLLSGTGPKCRGDQSQKSYQKWTHFVETMMISRTQRKPALSIRTGFSVSTTHFGYAKGQIAVLTSDRWRHERRRPRADQR
jgi:hypothetical protein